MVYNLSSYRKLKELKDIFKAFKQEISVMNKADLLMEVETFRYEAGIYPDMILTMIKGEILMEYVAQTNLLPNGLEEYNYYRSKVKERMSLLG